MVSSLDHICNHQSQRIYPKPVLKFNPFSEKLFHQSKENNIGLTFVGSHAARI